MFFSLMKKLFILLLIITLVFIGYPIYSIEKKVTASSGTSIRFYGNGENDIDRIKILLASPEKPINVGDNITIEFWIKASQSDNPDSDNCNNTNDAWINGHTIIDRDVYGSGDYGDFGISLMNGKLAFGMNNGTEGATVCSTTSIADNNWHHIALTRDSNGTMKIFVNGNLDSTLSSGISGNIRYRAGRSSSYPNDPYLVLGAEKHDAGNNYPSFNGYLDSLRISNIVRYTNSFSAPSTQHSTDENTVALYQFDAGSAGDCQTGTIITDSSNYSGGPSNGECKFGGNSNKGPSFSENIPFAANPTPTPSITPTPTDPGNGGGGNGNNSPIPIPTNCSKPFTDINCDNKFIQNINSLKIKGIINGYRDGTYRPSDYVTRAEMATFIVRAFNYTSTTDIPSEHAFKDNVEGVHQSNIYILYSMGIVNGFSDGTYRPDEYVNREQISKFIFKSLEKENPLIAQRTSTFTDIAEDNTFKGYIGYLQQENIIEGYSDGRYGPTDPLTREQMAKIIDTSISI